MNGTPLEPPLEQKEWIGEAILWASWRHQGDLMALFESELICVSPKAFAEVMFVHPRPYFYAKCYADQFIKYLNNIPKWNLLDVLRSDNFYKEAVRKSHGNGSHSDHDAKEDSQDAKEESEDPLD